jgi:hypothetical protein
MRNRIEYESESAPGLGDALAGQAITGVWMSGKTVERTVMSSGDRYTELEIWYTDGTGIRIRGQFTVDIADPADRKIPRETKSGKPGKKTALEKALSGDPREPNPWEQIKPADREGGE